MIEIEIDCGFQRVARECEQHVGPRKFYLHNRIGGEGWDVRPTQDRGKTIARFNNPQMATFIQLKL